MSKLTAAALALAVCIPVAAGAAETQSGLYLKAEAGWSWAGDAGIVDRVPSTGMIVDASGRPSKLDDIGDGGLLGLGVGYRINRLFRAELAVDYRGGYELDDRTGGNPSWRYKADIDSVAVMANGYVDLPVKLGPLQPYFGAGVGVARNHVDSIAFTDGANTGSYPKGSVNNFAWQLMGGVGIDVGGSFTLDVGYRYFDGGRLRSKAGPEVFNGAVVQQFGGVEGDLTAHEAVAGLRYAF